MDTTTAAASGQATATITSPPGNTITATPDLLATSSTTMSLIYIYSTTASAPLATASSTSTSSSSRHNDRRVSGGVIAGIVLGSIAVLLILLLALFCYGRKVARRKRAEIAASHAASGATSRAFSYGLDARASTVTTTITGGLLPRPPARSHRRESPMCETRSVGGMSGGAASAGTGRWLKNGKANGTGTASSGGKAGGGRGGGGGGKLRRPPPAELPTLYNNASANTSVSQVRMVHVARGNGGGKTKRPGTAEIYGSSTNPVELHGSSTPDLLGRSDFVSSNSSSEKAGSRGREMEWEKEWERKRERERERARNYRDSDVLYGSSGFVSPETQQHGSSCTPDGGRGMEREMEREKSSIYCDSDVLYGSSAFVSPEIPQHGSSCTPDGGRGRERERETDGDSDVLSSGYMSPEPGWHSALSRRGEHLPGQPTTTAADRGDTETVAAADAASIHIYYRNSAATIAQALSQASLRSSRMPGNIGMRSGSMPIGSQSSLAETEMSGGK